MLSDDSRARFVLRVADWIRCHFYGVVFAIVAVLMILIGAVTSHIFDDAAYAQHANWFYYLGINPLYYWTQGTYYLGILLAGYSPILLFQGVGIHNVVLEQIGVKLPFIVAALLCGLVARGILIHLGVRETQADVAAVLLVSSPIVFYAAAIHGTPIVIGVLFLLASLLYLFKGRFDVSALLFGVSASTFLYPIFSLPVFVRYVAVKSNKREAGSFVLWSIATLILGQLPPLFLYLTNGIPFSSGLLVSPGNNGVGGPAYPPSYSLYGILNLAGLPTALTTTEYSAIFILAMAIPSIVYGFGATREDYTPRNLVTFQFLQAATFVVFSPGNSPQYFVALAPFLIIEGFIWRESILVWANLAIGLLVLVTLATWGPGDIFGFLRNTDPSLGQFQQYFPSVIPITLGVVYGATVATLTFFWLRKRFLRPRIINRSEWADRRQLFQRELKGDLATSLAFCALSTLLVFAIVGSSLAHPPTTMQMTDQLNTWTATLSSSTFNNSSGITSITYELPGIVYLFNPETRTAADTVLNLTPFNGQILNWGALNATFSYSQTSSLAERLILPTSESSVAFQLVTYGEAPSNTIVELCAGDNLSSCNVVTKQIGNNATVTNISANGRVMQFQVNASFSAGSYFLIITGTSATTYFAGGSTDPPSLSIPRLIVNGVENPNATLALIVSATPLLMIRAGNSPPLAIENNGRFSEVNIPGEFLAPILTIAIGQTSSPLSSNPVLTLSIPFSAYEPLWNSQLLEIALGFATFVVLGFVSAWWMISLARPMLGRDS